MPGNPQQNTGRRPLFVAGAGLLLTLFYFAPASAYLFNSTEVSASFLEVLVASWPAQLACCLLIAVLSLAGPGVRRTATSLLLGFTLLFYLQGHILLWDYGRFDGSDIDFARHRGKGYLELAIWLSVLLLSLRWRARARRWALPLVGALVLLQTLSIQSARTGGRSFRPARSSAVHEDLARFSSERNVLMIVLDAFQAWSFEQVLRRDESVEEMLDGFVCFDDATGVYPTTLMSIPAILSGRTYDNTIPTRDFLRDALGAESLPSVLSRAGFDAQIVIKTSYCDFLEAGHCVGHYKFQGPGSKADRLREVLRIWDVALFRHVPHFLKSRVYDEHSWYLQRTFVEEPAAPEVEEELEPEEEEALPMSPSVPQQVSWAAWKRFTGEMELGNDRPTFKFLHLFTSHAPFLLGEDCEPITRGEYRSQSDVRRVVNQCACALGQVETILDRLRELEIYDETLVILTADHGSKLELIGTPSERGSPLPNFNRVFPLFLVKPFGASGPLRRSDAPVSLVDLPKTITEAVGIDAALPGYAVFDSIPPDRERVFYDYVWRRGGWDLEYLPKVEEYFIRGPAKLKSSWETGRELLAP